MNIPHWLPIETTSSLGVTTATVAASADTEISGTFYIRRPARAATVAASATKPLTGASVPMLVRKPEGGGRRSRASFTVRSIPPIRKTVLASPRLERPRRPLALVPSPAVTRPARQTTSGPYVLAQTATAARSVITRKELLCVPRPQTRRSAWPVAPLSTVPRVQTAAAPRTSEG